MIKKMLSTILCLLLLGSVSASEISGTENDDYLHFSSKYSKYEKDDNNKKSNPITPSHIALGALTIAVPVTILAALYKFLPSNNEAPSMEPAKLLQPIPYISAATPIDDSIGQLSEFSNKIYLIPGDLSTESEMDQVKWNTLSTFCNIITPLRAFYWRNSLCWFYSSLLLFYYNPVIKEVVLKFPVQDALDILKDQNSNLSSDVKNDLAVMIYLSKTFAVLQGKPTQTGPCVLNLDETFERNFVEALNNVCGNAFPYGGANSVCTGSLMGSLRNVSTTFLVKPETPLYNWSRTNHQNLSDLKLEFDHAAKKGPVVWFASNPSVVIESSGTGHFYLKIMIPQNRCITIGKSTTAGYEFDVEKTGVV